MPAARAQAAARREARARRGRDGDARGAGAARGSGRAAAASSRPSASPRLDARGSPSSSPFSGLEAWLLLLAMAVATCGCFLAITAWRADLLEYDGWGDDGLGDSLASPRARARRGARATAAAASGAA